MVNVCKYTIAMDAMGFLSSDALMVIDSLICLSSPENSYIFHKSG